MAIAIPAVGAPGFISNEDQYTTGIESLNNTFGLTGDDWNKSSVAPQEVVIICKNKNGRVSGILNSGVKINGHAEWTEMFGGGIMSLGGSLIETGNNFLQFTGGSSIQQPWMNRKMWKTTKPFSFDIPMSFVATTNPADDVVRPCMALLSFIFPRDLGTNVTNDKIVGGGDIFGTALNSLRLYNIPGPSLRYGTKSASPDDQGDPVEIVIGRLFAFGACYLEDVSIEFSQSLDSYGYPLAANVTVKATVMDSATCTTDGNFLIQEFYSSSESLGACLDQINNTSKQLAKDMIAIAKSGIGWYKKAFGKG